MEEFAINGRRIGSAHRPYLVAEMSANHGGDIARARRIIRLAADNGADAIKLQAYTADDLTIESDAPDFQLKSGLWSGQTLYQLYRNASTPYDWLGSLFEEADKARITAFATPFSAAAVDHLRKLGAPAYKIASFEAIDLELIRAAARTGKPLIISTGLCDVDDIARALEAAHSAGARDVALLKCTSAYPAEPDTQNLLTIPDMASRFGVPIGFSDHTLGNAAAISAVALGAVAIEKHFIDAHEPPTADFDVLLSAGRAAGATDRSGCGMGGPRHRALRRDNERNRVARLSSITVRRIPGRERRDHREASRALHQTRIRHASATFA